MRTIVFVFDQRNQSFQYWGKQNRTPSYPEKKSRPRIFRAIRVSIKKSERTKFQFSPLLILYSVGWDFDWGFQAASFAQIQFWGSRYSTTLQTFFFGKSSFRRKDNNKKFFQRKLFQKYRASIDDWELAGVKTNCFLPKTCLTVDKNTLCRVFLDFWKHQQWFNDRKEWPFKQLLLNIYGVLDWNRA